MAFAFTGTAHVSESARWSCPKRVSVYIGSMSDCNRPEILPTSSKHCAKNRPVFATRDAHFKARKQLIMPTLASRTCHRTATSSLVPAIVVLSCRSRQNILVLPVESAEATSEVRGKRLFCSWRHHRSRQYGDVRSIQPRSAYRIPRVAASAIRWGTQLLSVHMFCLSLP